MSLRSCTQPGSSRSDESPAAARSGKFPRPRSLNFSELGSNAKLWKPDLLTMRSQHQQKWQYDDDHEEDEVDTARLGEELRKVALLQLVAI